MNYEQAKETIKTGISCLDYLEKAPRSGYICPECGSGTGAHKTGAVRYYDDTNTWYCHACGKGGDVIDLAQIRRGTDYKEAFTFLAEGIQTNVRELEGAIKRLRAYCNTHGVTPTIPIARELLADVLTNEQETSVSVNTIKKVVGKHYNIRMEDFNAKRKTQSIAWPRQIAMFLTTELTDLSLPEIGREFNRDHSTVVHARDLVQEKVNADPFFTAEINQIIADIKGVEK